MKITKFIYLIIFHENNIFSMRQKKFENRKNLLFFKIFS